jgi:signal-transduction protein with cAMP-binding, CBS, and nucleotidyltransferase domain
MNVKELLRTLGPRELITIGPNAIVLDAAKLMEAKDVGALLIMEEGKLLGIVSERDFVRKIMARELNPESTSVNVVMTENPTVIGLYAQLEDCEGLMKMLNVRHLPVVDGGEIVGIVSMRNILTVSRQERTLLAQQYEDYMKGPHS